NLPPLFDDWSLSPLGYQPGTAPRTIVPRYSPGLPLLMAAAKVGTGLYGPFYVAPVLGGLCVVLTYLLGALLVDRLVGVTAALLLAGSPTFQLMLFAPMSDVPTTAAWTL